MTAPLKPGFTAASESTVDWSELARARVGGPADRCRGPQASARGSTRSRLGGITHTLERIYVPDDQIPPDRIHGRAWQNAREILAGDDGDLLRRPLGSEGPRVPSQDRGADGVGIRDVRKVARPHSLVLEDLRKVGRDNPKPIIMFSNNRDGEYIRQAVQAGVSAYVVDGLSKERILPIVEVAIARFREFQALRRELADTKVQLADRKIVDKAKGILIQRKGLTEEQAYALIRKTAMNRGLRIADVARTLLSLEGMDG